ncbi:hypothetical protein QQF64_005434 [Cirrhinus molitorella]|uniref:Secreted protein n=1 Tax=Cirrhinus molitorella TaxID=172907 RepID=A0ABR3MCP9_9TELE
MAHLGLIPALWRYKTRKIILLWVCLLPRNTAPPWSQSQSPACSPSVYIIEISAAVDPNTVFIIPVPLFHHAMSSGMLGILVKRQ